MVNLPTTKQYTEKPKASYSQIVSPKKVYVMDSLPITKQSIEKPKASYSQIVSPKKVYVMDSLPITKQSIEKPKANYSQVVSSKKVYVMDSLPITKQSIEKPKASYSQIVSPKKVYVMDSLPITKQSIEKPKANYSQVVSSKKVYVMDSLPITKQSIEKPKASYSQVFSSNPKPHHATTKFTPVNLQFNDTSVKAKSTTQASTYLPYSKASSKHTKNPQLLPINTQKNTPTASRDVSRNLQSSSLRLASKTSPRNSYADKAVNIFIEQITRSCSSYKKDKDINKPITTAITFLNKQVDYLTDNHREQLLNIIPTISKLIDTQNLDTISIVNILHSLAKTGICSKLNPNKTPIEKCLQQEQACTILIDKILTKLQRYKINNHREWNNILYSLYLWVEQSPYLITTETFNNLIITFNMQKQSLTKLNSQDISNILICVVKLLKLNKLDSKSSATYCFIKYFLEQIKPSVSYFNPQHISNTIYSIAKLSDFTEFRRLVSEKKNVIALLLQKIITNKNLILNCIDISSTIYGLGELIFNIYFGNELTNLTRLTYDFLLTKISPRALEFNIRTGNYILNGIIKLISSNIIIYNKPSIHLIRDIFLNKIIANPSIINNNKLYQYLYKITFFQEYLTKKELIKILDNINFFTPDINDLTTYFTGMGYLLVKIRKELNNDKKDKHLVALERKITTEITRVWDHFQPDIESFNEGNRSAMHNTCSLIYKAEDLTLLKVNYSNISISKFEEKCLAIIKTLIPTPESLKLEYRINSLPPVDACIIQPDGSMIAIEIQGPGHYLDDKGKYHTGKSLLKMARIAREKIKVIEVNGAKTMNYSNKEELATYLINLLSANNVAIQTEYSNNIPKLILDAGI